MSTYAVIRLKKGKEQSLLRKHPWVFSGAIAGDLRSTEEGSIVSVCDHSGNVLGTGYLQYGSIAVRMLSFKDEIINAAFFIRCFEQAFSLRKKLGLADNPATNCYRLIHGEGDGLSGLIVDVYAGTAVVQCHTGGMYALLPVIAEALTGFAGTPINCVYNKSKETLHGSVAGAGNGFLYGNAEAGEVLENGMKFMVDWKEGQKTGFFLDQRENRQLLGMYSKGKSVLNTFAYTGGFSVYAMMNGASRVDSVDVSKNAIEMLDRNMKLNDQHSEVHRSFASDTFKFFREQDELYDIVVLDPPAFAKNIGAKHQAIQGYRRLNSEGMQKVRPGGLLFTFSCSQAIDAFTFRQTILSAALESGRNIQILHRLSQPPDHPVSIYHPEGEYLKGLVLYLE